jgi:hypothetical protein
MSCISVAYQLHIISVAYQFTTGGRSTADVSVAFRVAVVVVVADCVVEIILSACVRACRATTVQLCVCARDRLKVEYIL